jgi:hypothetical protein
MQNVLGYGGKKTIKDGVINAFVEGARLSWVDVDDVAQVAALALAHPELHGGQTYRLGYDAVSFGELAELMTAIVGQPFRYEPLAPEVFLEAMRSAGAERAYMSVSMTIGNVMRQGLSPALMIRSIIFLCLRVSSRLNGPTLYRDIRLNWPIENSRQPRRAMHSAVLVLNRASTSAS